MSNIFYFCRDDTEIVDCKYVFLNELYGNSTVSLAFNAEHIFKYSCDWLYIIATYFHIPVPDIYNRLMTTFMKYRFHSSVRIPGKSVLVSSSFSSGTVHGYIGMFEILMRLQGSSYDTYVVHQNAQNGIKDLIKLVVNIEKIHYLLPDTVYDFEHLSIIPIKILSGKIAEYAFVTIVSPTLIGTCVGISIRVPNL